MMYLLNKVTLKSSTLHSLWKWFESTMEQDGDYTKLKLKHFWVVDLSVAFSSKDAQN